MAVTKEQRWGWVGKSGSSEDAQACGERINALRIACGGVDLYKAVAYDGLNDEDSPLYSHFVHDPAVALETLAFERAHWLIRNLRIVEMDLVTGAVEKLSPISGFVSFQQKDGTRRTLTEDEVRQSPDAIRALIQRFTDEVASAKRRLSYLLADQSLELPLNERKNFTYVGDVISATQRGLERAGYSSKVEKVGKDASGASA